MDPVEAALESKDAENIKKVRTLEKGDVTRIANRLESLLTLNDDGTFDMSNISSTNIDDVEKGLKVAVENVTKLHKNFVLLRQKGTDDAAEEALAKKDENYLIEVEAKYDKAALLVNKYRRQLNKEKPQPEVKADTDSSYFKLKKLEAPGFSGACREFAAWKRDFNSIVNVTGRPAVEIGATLKSCIPKKYHYLFEGLSFEEHDEMMSRVENKFGKVRVIVDEVVGEIRKMKPVVDSKGFVSFAEKLDRVNRDLKEMGMEAEIYNSTVLAELEQKLITAVCFSARKL